MTNLLIMLGILVVAFILVAYDLWRTNMDVPPNAEKPLGPLGQLRFALDNNIPIKTPLG